MRKRSGITIIGVTAVAVVVGAVFAIAKDDNASERPTDGTGDVPYLPAIDPAAFSTIIDHPFLPFTPGARWVYESLEDGEREEITVEVTDEIRTVMGVATIVVHDVVRVDGAIVEDTYDWYAQDSAGNVWYFGEDTTGYEDGVPTTAGSWEAGVDGAQPGIVMPAEPAVTGERYRQEFYPGEAEDMGEVVDVTADKVLTHDWTPLEPGVVEQKTYQRGVGLVREEKIEGGSGVVVLVEVTAR